MKDVKFFSALQKYLAETNGQGAHPEKVLRQELTSIHQYVSPLFFTSSLFEGPRCLATTRSKIQLPF